MTMYYCSITDGCCYNYKILYLRLEARFTNNVRDSEGMYASEMDYAGVHPSGKLFVKRASVQCRRLL